MLWCFRWMCLRVVMVVVWVWCMWISVGRWNFVVSCSWVLNSVCWVLWLRCFR